MSDITRKSDKCMALLKALGCEPTPQAYAVAFSYVENPKGSVASAVEGLVKSGSKPDQRTLDEIHETHVLGGSRAATASKELGDQIVKALEMIREASASTTEFGKSLDEAGDGFRSGGDVTTVLKGLIDSTHAMAVRQAELSDRLEEAQAQVNELQDQCKSAMEEARSDTLTGLRNRRAFEEEFSRDLARSERTREPLSLVVLDIDKFKQINDTWGHATGDLVIKEIAALVKQAVRTSDMPARIGGEEYGVVLTNADTKTARAVAERIRSLVAGHRLSNSNNSESKLPVTVSVGVATLRPGDTRQSLFERADAALYVAKNAGRNRVASENSVDCFVPMGAAA